MIAEALTVILIAGIGVGGSIGRRSIGASGAIGGDGAHGGPTTVVLAILDDADPVMTLDALTYTVTITNTGGNALVNASVTLAIDSDSTYVGSSAGDFDSIGESAGVVTADLASLAASGVASFTVTVTTPSSAQTLTADGDVTADNADPDDESETTVVQLVAKDSGSGIRVPASLAQWTSLRACEGCLGTPSLIWLCQEASGNLVDASGNGFTGTKIGTVTYNSAQAGWTRTGILFVDNSGDFIFNASASLPDGATESTMLLSYADLPGAHVASSQQFMQIGTNGSTQAGAMYRQASNSQVRVQFGGSAGVSSGADRGGQVRPYTVQFDRANSKSNGYTDIDKLVQSYTSTDVSSKVVAIGTGTPSPACRHLYVAEFFAANAELSTAQIKAMKQALAWTITWSP